MDRATSIRLGNDLLLILDLLARCRDRSVADEVRDAVRAHVAQQRKDPKLAERVDALLERDRAAARKLLTDDTSAA